MANLSLQLPEVELGIIWRYFDGVSQALARRFEGGSAPGEENLTFLLCELLDEGTTGLHLLDYPLAKAKEDLAHADGGITLDVTYQTHEHTKYVEHNFSGADLGVVFVVDHPYFGHSERAVLLQAKRLFPNASRYTLDSSFSSFHQDQLDLLMELARRFNTPHSIFYLWYTPSSSAFVEEHAKLIRSLEATRTRDWTDLYGWHPILDEMVAFSQLGGPGWRRPPVAPESDDREREWRMSQPAIRFSSLAVVDEVTQGAAPRLSALYRARAAPQKRRRSWRWLAFEPFAELFLLGLLTDAIGESSHDWLRLARGEKVPMPPIEPDEQRIQLRQVPEVVPTPRHSLTFTLRSTIPWPENLGLLQ